MCDSIVVAPRAICFKALELVELEGGHVAHDFEHRREVLQVAAVGPGAKHPVRLQTSEEVRVCKCCCVWCRAHIP